MNHDEKRDLIRFIANKLFGWYVDDWGEYREINSPISHNLPLPDEYNEIKYSIRPMKGRVVFDPIEDANCRDLVIMKMFDLGYISSVYVYNGPIKGKGSIAKFSKSNIRSAVEAESMGEAVCLAAKQALQRQQELSSKEEPRYCLDQVRSMSAGDREYHGN